MWEAVNETVYIPVSTLYSQLNGPINVTPVWHYERNNRVKEGVYLHH